MNQGRFITRNARYWPDQPAILFNGQVTTFKELDERSSRLANALLALGAKKGDRIGVQAAESLGVSPGMVLKTLMALVDGKPVCVIVPSCQSASKRDPGSASNKDP